MQQSKTILSIVLVALFFIGGAYMMTTKQSADSSGSKEVKPLVTATTPTQPTTITTTQPATTKTTTKSTTTTTVKPSTPSGYTASQVASHDSAASCWTVVNGNVYDVTSWITKHPGGQAAIKMMCGADASDAFNQQHGGQGGPERILASFKIGTFLN